MNDWQRAEERARAQGGFVAFRPREIAPPYELPVSPGVTVVSPPPEQPQALVRRPAEVPMRRGYRIPWGFILSTLLLLFFVADDEKKN